MRLARFAVDGAPVEGTLDGDVIDSPEGTFPVDEVSLLPPCSPTKVVAAGKNYVKHVEEMARRHGEEPEMPERPFLFLKPPSSVVGPDDPIVYPDGAERVDFEGEVAAVIDEPCRNVTPEEAGDYVLGVTAVNDVSWRDWSGREHQWFRHKGTDTFCPIGPYVQTEVEEPIAIESRVNGEVRQSADTGDLVFSTAELVAEASQYQTLEPGDVVATGTPSGVGAVQPGDVVEVEVEGVGTLRNPVVAAGDV